jgi:hypothetical protein
VIWADKRGTYVQIYYKRSSDGGINWGADMQLTSNTWYYTGNPSISVSGMNVHVIWIYNHNALNELFYKRSTDAGLSWEAKVNLGVVSNGGFFSKQASIISSGTDVHIVWSGVSGNPEISYKRSINGGLNWSGNVQLTNDPFNSFNPAVSGSGQLIHVVWQESRDGNLEIYYKRSADEGINWGPDTRLSNNPDSSYDPVIAVSGLIVNVVWVDTRNGNTEIYNKHSTDGGLSWGADTRLTNNIDSSWNPSVTASGLNVQLIWQDKRDGNWEVYYKHSTDGGINWSPDLRLTNNSASSQYPFITTSGQAVHVAWTDSRDGNQEIYYKSDPTGNPLGIININSHIPADYSLSQNFPNPFNPVTNIVFDLPSSSFTRLTVYDMPGREIAVLVNEQLKAGSYKVDWNATNYPSGIYFYKITSGDNYTETKKMILIK